MRYRRRSFRRGRGRFKKRGGFRSRGRRRSGILRIGHRM